MPPLANLIGLWYIVSWTHLFGPLTCIDTNEYVINRVNFTAVEDTTLEATALLDVSMWISKMQSSNPSKLLCSTLCIKWHWPCCFHTLVSWHLTRLSNNNPMITIDIKKLMCLKFLKLSITFKFQTRSPSHSEHWDADYEASAPTVQMEPWSLGQWWSATCLLPCSNWKP